MRRLSIKTVIKMERELIKKEQDMAKQYWDMVSLLTTVLNHNQIVELEYQDDISFLYKTGISSIAEELSGIWDYR